MIETIEQLIDFCKSKKSIALNVIIETEGTDSPYSKFLKIKTPLLVNILQTIKDIKQSQVDAKIDQEKISRLVTSAIKPLSESIPSIERIITLAEKKVQ